LDCHRAYKPTVSVIVPVLNARDTIVDLLDSLMRVDYDRDKLEIVIVDGGSTDGTQDLIRSYPVRMIVERRRGLNLARNTGLKNSSGEIVLFTDSDCVVSEDWVKKIVRNFMDSNVGCVGGTVLRYDDSLLSRYADESVMPVLRRFRKRKVLENVMPPLDYPAGCNMAFRREVFDKAGEFNEEIHYGFDEDELVERVCNAGYKMVLDPEVVVMHKHRGNLKDLLKQTFSYGRGGTLLLRKVGFKSRFARWNVAFLAAFLIWLLLCISSALLSFFHQVLILPLLLPSVFPTLSLIAYYVWKLSGRRILEAPLFACLDMLRLFAYCSGEIIGLIKG